MALKVDDSICYAYLINRENGPHPGAAVEQKLRPVLADLIDPAGSPTSEILDDVIALVKADGRMGVRRKASTLIVLKAIRHGIAESLL